MITDVKSLLGSLPLPFLRNGCLIRVFSRRLLPSAGDAEKEGTLSRIRTSLHKFTKRKKSKQHTNFNPQPNQPSTQTTTQTTTSNPLTRVIERTKNGNDRRRTLKNRNLAQVMFQNFLVSSFLDLLSNIPNTSCVPEQVFLPFEIVSRQFYQSVSPILIVIEFSQ